MHYTNLYGLPQAFVDAVMNDSYTGGGDISVTSLISTPQQRTLKKKYSDLIVVDVVEKMYSMYGQIAHGILERADKEAIVEERLYMEVGGWQVSGQLDRLLVEKETIQDWKTLSVFKKDFKGFEEQLNLYRLLAHVNGYKVSKLQVLALYRDWRRYEAKRGGDYPPVGFAVIDLPVWSLDDAQAFVEQRVAIHQAAEKGEVALCTDVERWATPTTYALLKEGGKRATKVASTREEIGEPAKGFVIEERLGFYRKCNEFCEVAPFCSQFKMDKSQHEESDGA
jgi:hypothetical protein